MNKNLFGDSRWLVDARETESIGQLVDVMTTLEEYQDGVRALLLKERESMKEQARSGTTFLASVLEEQDS